MKWQTNFHPCPQFRMRRAQVTSDLNIFSPRGMSTRGLKKDPCPWSGVKRRYNVMSVELSYAEKHNLPYTLISYNSTKTSSLSSPKEAGSESQACASCSNSLKVAWAKSICLRDTSQSQGILVCLGGTIESTNLASWPSLAILQRRGASHCHLQGVAWR